MMSVGVLLAVLGAAFLHALWNALIRVGASRLQAMVILSVMEIPMGLAVIVLRPLPPAEVIPWVLAAGVAHFAYKFFLAHAYEVGDLSRVYPIARGAAPMVAALAGAFLLTDAVTATEYAGIAVLGLGIVTMARGVFTDGESRRLLPFAFGSALATASYTLIDGMGARVSGDAIAYVGWIYVVERMTQHDRLLIIDFGSQVTQLIARRLRELNVYCEIHPYKGGRRLPARLRAQGGDPVGRPGQRLLGRRADAARLGVHAGRAGAGHLLWPAGDDALPGRQGRRRARHRRIRQGLVTPPASALPLLDGWFDAGREQVWMSHGDHVSASRRGSPSMAPRPTRPLPSPPTPTAASMPCSSTRRCTTPPRARNSMRISCGWPGSPATGRWAPTARRPSRRSAPGGRRAA
jgi:multidrug transporter EmrE-like cation transporter